ncbi:MAG: ankyrin repeat domain-containing protein [Verrucomicrobiota bacterium]
MKTHFIFRMLWRSSFLRGGAIALVVMAGSGHAFCGEIHIAAKNGDLGKVKMLVQADPGLISSTDDQGDTPLLVAVKSHHRDIVAFLVAHKANVNAKGKDESFVLGDGTGTGKSLGGTPLLWAAQSGDKDLVHLLLTNGADVNAANNGGWMPLNWAARDGGQEEVEYLLARNAAINATNNDGDTPLHLASAPGVARILRQHGGRE